MKLVELFAKLLSVLSGVLILAAAFLITYSAFACYLFSASSTWQNELSIYLLMASVWLASGPTMLAKRHVSVKLVSRFGNKFLGLFTHVFAYTASIAVGMVLLVKGVLVTMQAIHGNWHASTTWGPGLVGPYMIIPISLAFFLLAALITLLKPQSRR